MTTTRVLIYLAPFVGAFIGGFIGAYLFKGRDQ
jgi:hypothetical protein